jgi:tRNA(Ile)-lysidine synthase TilS/MesJ
VAVKRMLAEWEREHPGRIESIFAAIKNVTASHLADAALFDFTALERGKPTGAPRVAGMEFEPWDER